MLPKYYRQPHSRSWAKLTILWMAVATLTLSFLVLYRRYSQTVARADRIRRIQHNDMDTNIIQELFDALSAERLASIAKKYKAEYAQAKPFPHIVIDGLFPERYLEQVLKENPESLLNGGPCLGAAQSCFNLLSSNQNKKSAIEDESLLGLYTKILFSTLKSSTFTSFLEQLTAIPDIIADPHFRGSGMHFTASGGNLNIHADFNKYSRFNLDRRVNSFVFLNPDWKEEFGGHLELWSPDMKSCYQRILPTLGRFVVFSSTDFSYHGHPQPLATPSERARRSMALYYYTNGRPANECLNGDCSGSGHSTLFQKPSGCQLCEDLTCKSYADDLKPNWVEAVS